MQDWRGNEYLVGDTVLYPRQSGHTVSVVEGRVLEFTTIKQGYLKDRLAVVIQPTAESRYGWRFRYALPDLPKVVRITITDNITLLESKEN